MTARRLVIAESRPVALNGPTVALKMRPLRVGLVTGWQLTLYVGRGAPKRCSMKGLLTATSPTLNAGNSPLGMSSCMMEDGLAAKVRAATTWSGGRPAGAVAGSRPV